MESSPVRRVRAVLFDLDGTLFDHEGAALEALRLWMPTVGSDSSPTVVQAWFAAEERHVAAWREGWISWAEQRRRRVRDVVPGARAWSAAELDASFAGYLSRYQAAWRAFPEVGEVLEELSGRGLRLGILTNGAAAQQRAKLEGLGLGHRFEFVLTSEDLGVSKPDPESYRAACRSFGLMPAEVLHVGDLPDLDVTAPREAGLRALLIDRDNRHRQPDALRSLRELFDLLPAQ